MLRLLYWNPFTVKASLLSGIHCSPRGPGEV